MSQPERYEVKVSPQFLERAAVLPEDVREALMEAVSRLAENPYETTPLSRNPIVHLINLWRRWCRRRFLARRKS